MSWQESVILEQKFGKLTAKKLTETGSITRMNRWQCQCECGETVVVYQYKLLDGRGMCKKCRAKEPKPQGKITYKSRVAIVNAYKRAAKKRDLPWEITEAQALELMGKDCRYCGAPPKEMDAGRVYNGIDRVKNHLGYTTDNCVSCCATCNYMKSDMSLDDFVTHIYKLGKHMGLFK